MDKANILMAFGSVLKFIRGRRRSCLVICLFCLSGCGSKKPTAGALQDLGRPEVGITLPESGPSDRGGWEEPEQADVRDALEIETEPEAKVYDSVEKIELSETSSATDGLDALSDSSDLWDFGAGCEVDGVPCDDGDPCTLNDLCKSGECRGEPLVCLDDGIPCTLDYCAGGECVHPVKPGWCFIEKKCYPDGSLNLLNACEYCNSLQSQIAWTPANGWPCSDGDVCTEGDQCEDGVCIPGKNVCFPPECSYHTDCEYGRICGFWYVTGKTHCSKVCGSKTDCSDGEICTHAPGTAGLGYCQNQPSSDGVDFGQPCLSGQDCRSLLCAYNVCAEVCAAQATCAPGNVCFVNHQGGTSLFGACAPFSIYPQGLPFDFVCSNDGGKTYNPALCISRHCDLASSSPKCTRLCYTDTQCQAGQECNIIAYLDEGSADSIPFSSVFDAKTHDAVFGCYSIAATGYKPNGQECVTDQECKSNKCLPLDPNSDKRYCTTFCLSDANCPKNWYCRPHLLSLTSFWLEQSFSQEPRPDTFTIALVCKPN